MGLYLKLSRDELLEEEMKGRLIETNIELLRNIGKQNPNNEITLNDLLKGVYLVLFFGYIISVICFVNEFICYISIYLKIINIFILNITT